MENKTIFMIFSVVMVLVLLSHPTLAVEEDNDELPLISNDEFDTALYATSPSSIEYNNNIYGKTSEEDINKLMKCGKKTGYKTRNFAFLCFEEMIAEILVNKRASRDFCVGVVKAGKQCLMEFMKLFFQSYSLKRYNYKRFSRTNKVWNRCSTEIGAPSSYSG
ncbi:PREDICTED: uncharacterized protein LOC104751825 [Camelina sativa]|uniref:Uncharacterized protein LOC104751825 n=1 Tax=Camelina sativa TaxID=90675 RepID=A0ABM0WJZ2_CAMSA|nr:PREDICTED: uncharacterized protein LOC104751825 [Camelina sativa]